MHIAHQEDTLREAAHQFVERRAAAGGATRERTLEAVEHALLVAVGLQAADEPGARVAEALVVEIDWILRREHAADAEGARLLQECEHRHLRGRRRRRRKIAENFVHVEDGAER